MDSHKKIMTSTCSLSRKFKRESEADGIPDITPKLMKELNSKWVKEDSLDEHPVRLLINTLREHMDVINPYIYAVRLEQAKWHEAWLKVYEMAEQLDHAVDDTVETRFYSVPETLTIQELRARGNLSKAESEWEEAKLQYSMEIDKRNEEIIDIQNKIKLISEAHDVDVLNKYDSHPAVASKTNQPGKIATFFSAFGYHPKPVPEKAVSDGEQKLKSIRERLLIEYNDNLTFKTNSLQEYAERAPAKPVKYRQEWNAVKAQILHHQLEFYRCQNKEVMLNCLRLYVQTVGSYQLLYRENPLAVEKKQLTSNPQKISLITDCNDKIVGKAKLLFKQMIEGMNNQLSTYYCLQPNRFEFTQYRDNFNRIRDPMIRDAIMQGNADEDMLALIFTEFETPLEAFQLSSSTP